MIWVLDIVKFSKNISSYSIILNSIIACITNFLPMQNRSNSGFFFFKLMYLKGQNAPGLPTLETHV